MKKATLDLRNMDCMEIMKEYPDGYFDLAIVDPVFGHPNIQGGYTSGKGTGIAKPKDYKRALWKQKKTGHEYFTELFRVSKNQIIWGGNYFANNLPISMGWVFWDKDNGKVSFSDGELAWTSFQMALRRFKYRWSGMLQENMKNKEDRIHDTQKPVALYRWLLENYAKPGDKILDTHLGSGSIAIACHELGFNLTASELDTDYYNDMLKRVNKAVSQTNLFTKSEVITNSIQKELF